MHIGEMKIAKIRTVSRYSLEPAAFFIAEKKRTRIARTKNLTLRRFDQMGVTGDQLYGAKIASLDRNAWPNKTAKDIERLLHKPNISACNGYELAVRVSFLSRLSDLNEAVRHRCSRGTFNFDRDNIRRCQVDRLFNGML